jgi:transcriptional regulator
MTFYVPRHFRHDDREDLEAFVAAHAFGTLVSNSSGGLAVSHLPFLPVKAPDGSLRLAGHMARANDHWKSLESAGEVLVIFEGPHAYVSPTWYRNHPAVPTWNYAVVHARGRARLTPPEALPALVDALAKVYEDGRPRPWRMAEQPPEFTARMMPAIVGFEVDVGRLEGKFKLSQNRAAEDVAGVIAALEGEGQGELAGLMGAHAVRKGESR